MNITQNLITCNFTKRTSKVNEWIVIHYFGSLGDDSGVVQYFNRDGVNASAHYALDDDSITQAVLDSNTAWHCGDSGIGTFKGKCCNANSIGIEVRPYKLSTATMGAGDKDWYFHAQTIVNLTWLVKMLMAKYNIDADHVIRHFDVTAKWCPRPWMGDDINSYYGKSGNQLWAEFKAALTAESEDSMPRYNTIDEVPEWGKKTVQKLIDSKAFNDGDSTTPAIDGLNLSEDMIRTFVANDRMGLYK